MNASISVKIEAGWHLLSDQTSFEKKKLKRNHSLPWPLTAAMLIATYLNLLHYHYLTLTLAVFYVGIRTALPLLVPPLGVIHFCYRAYGR